MNPKDAEALIAGYLRVAQESARSEFGIELDFSRESLNGLARILHTRASEMEGQADDEDYRVIANVWGVYFGEVLCRCMGASWMAGDAEGGLHVWVDLEGLGVHVIESTEKALRQGRAIREDWPESHIEATRFILEKRREGSA